MKIKKTSKLGFSLIEVIIAFSILSITVLGATNLISNSIQNNQENILRVQAYFLAQEGLELTRAYRDTLWLSGQTNFNLPVGTFTIEFPNINNPLELSQTSPNLFLQNSPYKFSHLATSNTTETFTRTISIQTIPNVDEQLGFNRLRGPNDQNIKNQDSSFSLEKSSRLVISTVNYDFNGQEKKIELKTILSNWKQP